LSYLVDQSLDGVITYPNQLPDLNSSEEVEVRTGNSAEVDAPGQATVFVLKSGGDQFHGRVKHIKRALGKPVISTRGC
jgi:hypothetical protein